MCDFYMLCRLCVLDVVCDELNYCAWNVCLISVCMFIVSNAFPMSSATVIVRAGGAI